MAPYADMREPPAARPCRKVKKSDDSMPTLNQIATRLETGEASRALVDQCLERIKDAAGEGPRAFLKVYGDDARRHRDRAPAGGRVHSDRPHQHDRVRVFWPRHQPALRYAAQPV